MSETELQICKSWRLLGSKLRVNGFADHNSLLPCFLSKVQAVIRLVAAIENGEVKFHSLYHLTLC